MSTPSEPNYAQIENKLNKFEGQLTPELQKVFLDAKKKMTDLVTRRFTRGGLDAKFIQGLELRGLGDMVPLLRGYLQSVYQSGQQEAHRELHE